MGLVAERADADTDILRDNDERTCGKSSVGRDCRTSGDGLEWLRLAKTGGEVEQRYRRRREWGPR